MGNGCKKFRKMGNPGFPQTRRVSSSIQFEFENINNVADKNEDLFFDLKDIDEDFETQLIGKRCQNRKKCSKDLKNEDSTVICSQNDVNGSFTSAEEMILKRIRTSGKEQLQMIKKYTKNRKELWRSQTTIHFTNKENQNFKNKTKTMPILSPEEWSDFILQIPECTTHYSSSGITLNTKTLNNANVYYGILEDEQKEVDTTNENNSSDDSESNFNMNNSQNDLCLEDQIIEDEVENNFENIQNSPKKNNSNNNSENDTSDEDI